jgi:hypothetical protein
MFDVVEKRLEPGVGRVAFAAAIDRLKVAVPGLELVDVGACSRTFGK